MRFDFSALDLRSVSFKDAFLIEADLQRANLDNTSFQNAYLRNVDFAGASLNNSDMLGADWFNALHLTQPQILNVKRGSLRRPPANVAKMHAFLTSRYLLPFESWSEDVRRNLVAAWDEYLKPGGLCQIVSEL